MGNNGQVRICAESISLLQSCPRKPILQLSVAGCQSPRSLFDQCLLKVVQLLSEGKTKSYVAEESAAWFRELAVCPGIQTSGDPFTTVQDFTGALRTVVEAFSRRGFDSLKPAPRVRIADGVVWYSDAMVDKSGLLHRWSAVERFSNDVLTRELHGWQVIGDTCSHAAPMVLHLVELGRVRDGHLHSPWCRVFRHPSVMGRFAFQKQDGSKLEGAWKPLWFGASRRSSPGEWVDMMERDGLKLIHDVRVAAPAEKHRSAVLREIEIEAARLRGLPTDFRELPMHRGACDLPPCPWKTECYLP